VVVTGWGREGNGWEGEGKDRENDNWVSRLGSWDRREILESDECGRMRYKGKKHGRNISF
jgi:hypothetical protein